jgi:ankyrin repeat protein/L-ascorbate metabolism protein UlaG (beta-lactamase superfamily)
MDQRYGVASGSGAFWIALAFILAAAAGMSAQTIIIEAALSGDLEAVARLLKTDPKLFEAKNADGDTALHAAAGCRRGEQVALPIVRLLLEKGATVDAKNTSNQTPLLYAAYGGFRQVVDLLISKGAVVQYQDTNGRSPIHYAAREGHPEVVEVLFKNGANPSLRDNQNRTPLEYAVLRDKTAVVETLMKLIRFDAKSPEGSMILHSAASQGNEALVKTLLDKGADPNAADKGGLTALDIALDWGFRSVAALLTAKGARPTRPKVHLLKGGSFEIADSPAGAQAPSAVIRYIGNEGFLIEAGSKTVLVDGLVRNPWGYANTPERAPDLTKAAQAPFERIDLLLFSHAHRDHFEPKMALEVLSAQAQAVLVGDNLVSGELKAEGPDAFKAIGSRIKTMDIKMGERMSLTIAGIPLSVIGVNHGSADRPYLTLGYIMEIGGFKIYHQGDIFPDANMPFLKSLPWEDEKIDIAFFDPFFFQNEEAKRIVLERIKPSAVILMHMMNDEVDGTYGRLSPGIPQLLAFRAAMESKVFVKAVQ